MSVNHRDRGEFVVLGHEQFAFSKSEEHRVGTPILGRSMVWCEGQREFFGHDPERSRRRVKIARAKENGVSWWFGVSWKAAAGVRAG